MEFLHNFCILDFIFSSSGPTTSNEIFFLSFSIISLTTSAKSKIPLSLFNLPRNNKSIVSSEIFNCSLTIFLLSKFGKNLDVSTPHIDPFARTFKKSLFTTFSSSKIFFVNYILLKHLWIVYILTYLYFLI